MKTSTLFFLMLMVAFTSFAQKGKDKDAQILALKAQVDTLKKSNEKLTIENKAMTTKTDSLSTALGSYYGLYTVIKDKVVKMDFKPEQMSAIIDSLRAGRDSLISLSGASSIMLRDSLKQVIFKSDSLKKETEGLLYTVNLLRGKSTPAPADLKDFTGTWSVIVRKVKIIGESPRAGIIDITNQPAAKTDNFLQNNTISKLTFIDGEFSELTFSNGEKVKCYYLINDFNKTKPYSIDFKGAKTDVKVHFITTNEGLRISYQIPGVPSEYYYGLFTR